MDENDLGVLIERQHPVSKRWAVFEDDGTAGYLYLTEPGRQKPVRDCWVYNRIPAPVFESLSMHRDGPPPACQGYVGENALYSGIDKDAVQIRWSQSGEAVALTIEGIPAAYVTMRLSDGFSRNVIKPGPWGMPWDEDIFQKEFGDIDV